MTKRVQLFALEMDTSSSQKMNDVLRAEYLDSGEMSPDHYLQRRAQLQIRFIRSNLGQVDEGARMMFLAPEFFFKWRDGLPYQRSAFDDGMAYMQAASRAVGDVLWIPGTVWWMEPVVGEQVRVHNTALVIQNGTVIHRWQKERLSNLDGLRRGVEVWDRRDEDSARILEMSQDPFFTASPLMGGADMSCGLEVCLDHRSLPADAHHPLMRGVLRTKYTAAHDGPPVTGDGIDVHVLTAAGMPLQNENVLAKDGGVIFRSDGGGASQGGRSQAVRIARPGFGTPPENLRLWNPTLTPMPVRSHDGQDPDHRLAIYPSVDVP